MQASKASGDKNEPSEIHAEKVSKTQHAISLGDKTLSYSAVAGEIIVNRRVDGKTIRGRIFYVYYKLGSADQIDRPITFAFNGGPGAASVWLHLGGVGPKRIRLAVNGERLPPPVQLENNATLGFISRISFLWIR